MTSPISYFFTFFQISQTIFGSPATTSTTLTASTTTAKVDTMSPTTATVDTLSTAFSTTISNPLSTKIFLESSSTITTSSKYLPYPQIKREIAKSSKVELQSSDNIWTGEIATQTETSFQISDQTSTKSKSILIGSLLGGFFLIVLLVIFLYLVIFTC